MVDRAVAVVVMVAVVVVGSMVKVKKAGEVAGMTWQVVMLMMLMSMVLTMDTHRQVVG